MTFKKITFIRFRNKLYTKRKYEAYRICKREVAYFFPGITIGLAGTNR